MDSRQIYIAFRRDASEKLGTALTERLRTTGYTVYNETDLSDVQNCADFLIVLCPGCMDNCKRENDWIRMQLEEARRSDRNIVVILADGFEFPTDLPVELAFVTACKSVRASGDALCIGWDRFCKSYLVSKPKRKPTALIVILIAILAALVAVYLLWGNEILALLFPKAIVSGMVTDAYTGLPLAGARVGNEANDVLTDSEGTYELALKPGEYSIFYTLDGYESVEEVFSLAKKDVLTKNVSLSDGHGIVCGTVTNAVDGSVIADVTVTCGDTSTMTDADGVYSLSLEKGSRTLEFTKDGFISVRENINVLADTQNDFSAVMSAELANDEYRVVLTWLRNPNDLDSHLCGSGFHVYYNNRTPTGSNAQLDLDDTNGYGPETTTFKAQPGEKYVFYVHDYRETGKLPVSEAVVKIYCGNVLIAERTVPSTDGKSWKVFTLMDGEFTFDDAVNDLEPARYRN